jgi:hypothetical protein
MGSSRAAPPCATPLAMVPWSRPFDAVTSGNCAQFDGCGTTRARRQLIQTGLYAKESNAGEFLMFLQNLSGGSLMANGAGLLLLPPLPVPHVPGPAEIAAVDVEVGS